MNYKGVIIEESLKDKRVLDDVSILETTVEEVNESHQTPWIKQWTLHTVEISEDKALGIAEELSRSLDSDHSWYADFKNADFHYIVFRNKFFKVDRKKKEQYDDVVNFGLSLGIPYYQLDFSPDIK
jgi:hypothetical protein